MATYNFTYKNITVTVEVTNPKATVSFLDPDYTNLVREYEFKASYADFGNEIAYVHFDTYLKDNGTEVGGSRVSHKKIPCTTKEFQAYYNMTVGWGEGQQKLAINGLLSTLPEFEGIRCFKVADLSLDFYEPIEVSVVKTDETVAGTDGTITISKVQPDGYTLEYSIDGGSNYQGSGEFTGLSAGSYDIIARNVVDNDIVSVTKTITINPYSGI